MRAAIYTFQGPVDWHDPSPADHGAVLRVEATGVCRSDWHGWMGHDPDIRFPHVPGTNLPASLKRSARDVRNWKPGARVTVPFVCACGTCPQCKTGNHQVCDRQNAAGIHALGFLCGTSSRSIMPDTNLVALPDDVDFATAASLGCRFGTSFRAISAQGNVEPGNWVAVHGCGGVGLIGGDDRKGAGGPRYRDRR